MSTLLNAFFEFTTGVQVVFFIAVILIAVAFINWWLSKMKKCDTTSDKVFEIPPFDSEDLKYFNATEFGAHPAPQKQEALEASEN